MPTAPLYNGPQVTPGQFSGGQLSTNVADMSAIGRGISQLGEGLGQMWEQEKRKAEDEQLTQALSKARELQTAELYDPQDGIMYKQGGDLFGIASDRLNGFRQKLSGIRETLGSVRVKSQFDRASDSLWQEYNRSVQLRVGSEREKTSEAVMDGYVRQEVNSVSTNLQNNFEATVPHKADGAPDFTAIDDSLLRIDLSVKDRVQNDPGGFPEGREAAARNLSEKKKGEAVKLYIDTALAQGKTAEAKAMVERYGDLIPLEFKPGVIKAVEAGTVADEAQQGTDDIMFAVDIPQISLTEQEKQANALIAKRYSKDAKMRDEVQKRVTAEFNRRNALHQQSVQDSYKDYYERLNKGEKIDRLIKEPRFHTMDPAHQEMVKKFAEEKEAGKDLGKDLGKIYRFQQLAYSNDERVRDSFRTMDLAKQGLTPKEFDELSKIQIQLQKAHLDENAKVEYESIRNVHEISEDAARVAGFADKSQEKYDFQKRLEERVREVEKRSGKKVVPEDVQKMADELLLKKAEGMLSRDKYLFQLTPEELNDPQGKIAWDKIPDADKNRIRTQWQKSKGKTPEKEDIQRFYFNEIRLRQQTRGIKFQQ
jgi:hypothetical protein